MQLDNEARALLDRYRKPAILLHRPYPPQPSPTRNSFFGGLPNLPADLEWPRTTEGAPMHFLCQIDLSEIGWTTELPSEGFLFVFGHECEGIDWGDREPEDDCRILYWQQSSELPPVRPAPEDIEHIWGCWGDTGCFHEAVLPGEKHRTVHVKWPIQFLKIDTYPDQGGLPPVNDHTLKMNEQFRREWQRVEKEDAGFLSRLLALFHKRPSKFVRLADRLEQMPDPAEKALWDRYEELLPLERGLAYERATGQPIENSTSWRHEKRDVEALLSDGLFPWLWMDVSYFSRFMLKSMRSMFGVKDDLAGPQPMGEMRAWLDRSLSVDQTLPLSSEDRHAFIDWLNQLRLRDEAPEPARFHREIRDALKCTVRELAHDPALFSVIPEPIRDAFSKYFASAELQGPMTKLRPRFYFSQMLGHPSLSQSDWRADNPDICLLRLSSDPGLGWIFADVGELVFHLPSEAMVESDFHQVRGMMEGG